MKIRTKKTEPNFTDDLESYIEKINSEEKEKIKNIKRIKDNDKSDKKKNKITVFNDAEVKDLSKDFSKIQLNVGISLPYYITKCIAISLANRSYPDKTPELIASFFGNLYLEYVDGIMKFCLYAIWIFLLFDMLCSLLKKNTGRKRRIFLLFYIFSIIIILYLIWNY